MNYGTLILVILIDIQLGLGVPKNSYTINANKFTSKPVLLKERVSLGKWDISEEALFRYIKISEEDSGAETTDIETYEMSKALKS